jgi:penicillin V acylase-like amidase (Ntn superfamily)
VTFNLIGYQFPWAGMNEAGLIISTMSLAESQSPVPDARPPLETERWIQYQLDNYSSFEQVIASESQVGLTSKVPGCCHFLVCDRKGDCATVEMLEGKIVYHLGETLPVIALTNSIYFRSKWNSQIRGIDFSRLDFACGTPVQMLDVHANRSGDISMESFPCTNGEKHIVQEQPQASPWLWPLTAAVLIIVAVVGYRARKGLKRNCGRENPGPGCLVEAPA